MPSVVASRVAFKVPISISAARSARSAAERQMGLPVVRGLVDVHPAGTDTVGELEPAREVAREDGGEQSVRRRVRELDGLIE